MLEHMFKSSWIPFDKIKLHKTNFDTTSKTATSTTFTYHNYKKSTKRTIIKRIGTEWTQKKTFVVEYLILSLILYESLNFGLETPSESTMIHSLWTIVVFGRIRTSLSLSFKWLTIYLNSFYIGRFRSGNLLSKDSLWNPELI